MEHLHGIEALSVLLTLNVLMFVGKLLWKLIEKKSDATEKSQKESTIKMQKLSEDLANIEGRMDRLMNVISSYMETTINFATKLGAVEKQLEHFSEKLKGLESVIDGLR